MSDIPFGFCHCGCGQKVSIAARTRTERGVVRGQPNRYAFGHEPTRSIAERFWEKVDIRDADKCWPWLGGGNKYGIFDGTSAHRTAYRLTYGDFPNELEVCHTCDNPPCCNPAHLFLGTEADNAADKVAKGRHVRMLGESHPNHKLTEPLVLELRKRVSNGETQASVAKDMGISSVTASDAVRYVTWKHVP